MEKKSAKCATREWDCRTRLSLIFNSFLRFVKHFLPYRKEKNKLIFFDREDSYNKSRTAGLFSCLDENKSLQKRKILWVYEHILTKMLSTFGLKPQANIIELNKS